MIEVNAKETLEYVVGLKEDQTVVYEELNGKTYIDTSKGSLKELEPIQYANTLVVNSITGLVDYLKSKFDTPEGGDVEEVLINIESPTKISVLSHLNADRKREQPIEAKAILEKFPFGSFMSSEKFNINILSLFDRTDDSEAVLACASSIRIEGGADLKDNGISQHVTVVQGANATKAEVPSPAVLRPYRTFLEVAQPESQFIFRIDKNGDCALFEADGGLWKYEAMASVKEYLEEQLEVEISEGQIKIIA